MNLAKEREWEPVLSVAQALLSMREDVLSVNPVGTVNVSNNRIDEDLNLKSTSQD